MARQRHMEAANRLQSKLAHPFSADEERVRKEAWETRRVEAIACLHEHNLQEALCRFGFRPKTHNVQELLDQGGLQEDAQNYEAAVKLYQKALALEPEHHVLREHIGMLTRRLNALAVLRKQIDREDEMTSRLQDNGATNSLPFSGDEVRGPRKNLARGYVAQPSPAEYGRQLRAQAAEHAAQREDAKRRERMLDQQILDTAASLHSHDLHDQHVRGGDKKLAWKHDLQAQMRLKQEQRVRNYQEAQQRAFQGSSARGPLQGVGELALIRAQRPVSTSRPQSAGVVAKAGPGVQAPFARPSVDKPVQRIDPQQVRAHQQAYLEKHAKRDMPGQLQRLAAQREFQRRTDW